MATQRQQKDKEKFEKEKGEFEKHIDTLALTLYSPNPDVEKVREIIQENFKQYAKLHTPYSEYNTNWANKQMQQKYQLGEVSSPFLTYPANFKQWTNLANEKGERVKVKSGAKALFVLRPKIVKEAVKNPQDDKLDSDKEQEEIKNQEIKYVEVIKGFAPIKVFDVTQTNAIEIGAIKPFDFSDLADNNEAKNKAYDKTIEYLKNSIENRYGLKVTFDNSEKLSSGNVGGFISFDKKEIVVKDDLPLNLKLATLAHELGHYLCQHNNKNKNLSLDIKEMQAETFAYLVTAKLGMNNSQHIDYIQKHLLSHAFRKSNRGLIDGNINDKAHLANLRKHFIKLMSELKEPYSDFYKEVKFGTFLEKEIAPIINESQKISIKNSVDISIQQGEGESLKIKN